MEALKKYIFWVITAVVILIAIGAWSLTVPGIKAETQNFRNSSTSQLGVLSKASKKPDEIKTSSHVKAAQAFGKHLDTQKDALLELWTGRGLEMAGAFPEAPPADAGNDIEFERWLVGVRKLILNEAAQKGLALPKDFAEKHLYQGSDTKTAKERERRPPRLAIVREIVKALGSVRVQVPTYEFQADAKVAEKMVPKLVGPMSLERLQIRSAADREMVHRRGIEMAYVNGGGSYSVSDDRYKIPYKGIRVSLQFKAPMQAVTPALQRLESSDRYFAIIQKVDCARTIHSFPRQVELSKIAPVGPPNGGKGTGLNTHYEEAPVKVLVVMDLLEFNSDVAKAMMKAPAAKKKKKSKKGSSSKSKKKK